MELEYTNHHDNEMIFDIMTVIHSKQTESQSQASERNLELQDEPCSISRNHQQQFLS